MLSFLTNFSSSVQRYEIALEKPVYTPGEMLQVCGSVLSDQLC
jgi:hypothetical protein